MQRKEKNTEKKRDASLISLKFIAPTGCHIFGVCVLLTYIVCVFIRLEYRIGCALV